MFPARGTRKSRCPALNIAAFADHGETMGDREQLAAAFDPVGVETAGEKLPHRRHEGGTAGEEHLVDRLWCNFRLLQNLVQRTSILARSSAIQLLKSLRFTILRPALPSGEKLNSASWADDSAILVAEIA